MMLSIFEMEKGQSTGTLDSTQMKSLDQTKQTESHDFNDVMYRRMKNRERQRRYRARKRLEADNKDSLVMISEPTPLPIELQHNGNVKSYVAHTPLTVEPQLKGNRNSFVTHEHRRRNWKKDARRAHEASKDMKDRSSGSFSPAQTLTNESQIPCLFSGVKVESSVERDIQSVHSPAVVNCETPRTKPGRRDWKSAARNKIING